MPKAVLSRSGRLEWLLSAAATVTAMVMAGAPAAANGIFHDPTTTGEKVANDTEKAVDVTGKAIEEKKTIDVQFTQMPGGRGTGSGGPRPGTGSGGPRAYGGWGGGPWGGYPGYGWGGYPGYGYGGVYGGYPGYGYGGAYGGYPGYGYGGPSGGGGW